MYIWTESSDRFLMGGVGSSMVSGGILPQIN